MAGAEARAVWQRTANRYFVQEDAKRAPKLACCQSSSAPTKQVDAGPASGADETDHAPTGFMPFSRNPSLYNLTPRTKWWLHLQPEYGCQKGVTRDQLNELDHTMDKFTYSYGSIFADLDEFELQKERSAASCDSEKDDSSLRLQSGTSAINEGLDTRKVAAYGKNDNAFLEITDTERTCKTVEMDPINSAVFEKPDGFAPNPELPWLKGNKTVPWWRTSDRDELASLVFQKSLDHVENCDLPPPQKYVCRCRYHTYGDDKRRVGSFDSETRYGSCMVLPAYAQSGSTCETKRGKPRVQAYTGHLQSLSTSSRYTTSTQRESKESTGADSGNNSGKDELLEALRHSQTRAREAEEAAKKAYAEKEDIVKLLFKQASQLFAYKQWFQLLQLETACFHVKNKDQSVSTLCPPSFLPWTSYQGRKSRKRWQKNSKVNRGKRLRTKNDVTTYAVAFALGLSLVGAGLLLGWTVGWMLPL